MNTTGSETRISMEEAGARLPQLLQCVQSGERFLVEQQGTPLALLIPVESGSGRDAAKKSLLIYLRQQPLKHLPPWSRDELYEDVL